jgi:hypothetical protein
MKDAWDEINDLKRRLNELETLEQGSGWVYLSQPLTSTSWDGDSHSTTGYTLIDLSSVFGAPARIKAVSIIVHAHDSGSAGITDGCWIAFSPNSTPAGAGGQFILRLEGIANDAWHSEVGTVTCDSNGDIYWKCIASGANTMDIGLEIWGYYI